MATAQLPDDDTTIPGAEELLRRIPPDWVIFDGNQQRYRATSRAFDDISMSVYLGSGLLAAHLAYDAVVEGHVGWSAALITANDVRAEGQHIVRDPDPDDDHPRAAAHALVIGNKSTKGRSRLAKRSVLAVQGDVSKARPDAIA